MRYDRRVIGYHACLRRVADRLLLEDEPFRPSKNQWDWLGHGVYFWEFGHQRAHDWAAQWPKLQHQEFAIVGAIIQLGQCLDLLDTDHTKRLATFGDEYQRDVGPLPENQGPRRERDCLLVNQFCDHMAAQAPRSIRYGPFSRRRARAGGVCDSLAKPYPGRGAPASRDHRLVPSKRLLRVARGVACIIDGGGP